MEFSNPLLISEMPGQEPPTGGGLPIESVNASVGASPREQVLFQREIVNKSNSLNLGDSSSTLCCTVGERILPVQSCSSHYCSRRTDIPLPPRSWIGPRT